MRRLLICGCFLNISLALFSQAIHKVSCGKQEYTFSLPDHFRESHLNYTEGDYRIYYKIDSITKKISVQLVVHCGRSVMLPHLKDSSFVVEVDKRFDRCGYQYDGHYWRELNLPHGLNVFYKNANSEEKAYLDSLFDKHFLPESWPLTTTIKQSTGNLYNYVVSYIIDSLHTNYHGAQYVLLGDKSSVVNDRWIGYPILKAKQEEIFDGKGNLTKAYKKLVGEDLICFYLRDAFLESSRLKIHVILNKTVYSGRRTYHSELIENGLWVFVFKYQEVGDSYVLESLQSGIEL